MSTATGTGLAAYGYDTLGNRTTAQTMLATFTNSYNCRLLTQVIRTAGASPQNTRYHCDLVGNLTALDDPTGTISCGYDAANRVTSLTDQGRKITSYGYDNADHRTSATLPGGTTETTGVDASGRQTAITVKNTAGTVLLSSTDRYTRTDGSDTGSIQSHTDAAGTSAYTYDGFGRLTQAGAATTATTSPATSPPATGTPTPSTTPTR
ncbi:RHS repeat domain-containing protein [Amycolatopsis sp. DSM 110486]|uniref:RHS repeat domain-containing protein n=1 Tax=Amycolatopsis sp. DSM 110486 TaxID=2865832 RepID=UPI0021082609|nr:RHS repeat domain-containing protein [Amycolatopsis sp. DSM 110486]